MFDFGIHQQERADTLAAAIDYALHHTDDGLLWLRDWNSGEPEAMAELDAHRKEQSEMRKPPRRPVTP